MSSYPTSTEIGHAFGRLHSDVTTYAMGAENRIATLEAMVEEAIRIFDLHLNTPETQALRAQWKEMKKP